MSDLDTFVESSTTISNAQSPTVQSFNVALFAAYHNLYAARVKLYATSSVLTQLVSDGFSTSSATYKAAEAYAAAPNAPATFAVGRRALPPTQVLQLGLTDGTVSDQYSFNIVGSDGKSHAVTYTNVINPGSALPTAGSTLTGTATLVPGSLTVTFSASQTLAVGALLTFSTQTGVAYTVSAATTASTTATLTAAYSGAASTVATTTVGATTTVANGSANVTFSTAQTLAKGALLMFAGQPGVYYALSAVVTATTTGILTSAFQGTSGSYGTTTIAPLAGTNGGFDVINGSSIVATTASQVAAINPGDSVVFGSQLGVFYTVAAVSASAVTLTTPYTGSTVASAFCTLVCQVSTAATYITYLLGLITNIGATSIVNNSLSFPTIVQITQLAGALNDINSWRTNGFHGVNGFGNIELTNATADPGIVTDLTAMVAAAGIQFYGIMLDSNSAAEIESAAGFIEAQGGQKFGFFDTSDYNNGQLSSTTDVFSATQALSLKQSFLCQNDQQVLCFQGAATAGQMLAMNPGSYSFTYKALPLVPADNDQTLSLTERTAINSMSASNTGVGGKNGNYYFDASGEFTIWPGCTPSGQFCDLTIGENWLNDQIQAAAVVALASLPKVPIDNFGIGLVGDAITAVLNLAASPLYNFILPNGADPERPITVEVPDVDSLTPAQRATRDISGIRWSAGLQGAIDTAVIAGTLLP